MTSPLLGEFLGTKVLILLGDGVVAGVLLKGSKAEGSGWIVEAAGSGDFDSIDSTRLRQVLRQRGNDGRMRRLIGKWWRAGVMDAGALTHPETGVVQGGVISPVLAHVFLHSVLSRWT